MLIGKTFNFEAAHQLPNHDGKCRNLHGHSYKVEVVLEGPVVEAGTKHPETGAVVPDEGMVLDFSALKEVWNFTVHDRLDHKFLNDVIPGVPTTAENIAVWILAELRKVWVADWITVKSVTVWETATSWARAE